MYQNYPLAFMMLLTHNFFQGLMFTPYQRHMYGHAAQIFESAKCMLLNNAFNYLFNFH